ncbi:hypothetical protein BO86DRAFT_207937 [Aspergillus japonicus CBS 114.51]|uniref:Uncharacterized protein n=1 Tax=Aspergillus japonicus CBS 114.51 TaxID=1448312 RepID=A0A8T8WPY5_ASPJA|nr:hypothetical protein BO86DRAFT_207937 [Aspergillus japonicus CBS 114.51]RAH77733.1 hypothetical protein BO86DRAFT_207937 [Aspergillus japonicus CBS 114.51]
MSPRTPSVRSPSSSERKNIDLKVGCWGPSPGHLRNSPVCANIAGSTTYSTPSRTNNRYSPSGQPTPLQFCRLVKTGAHQYIKPTGVAPLDVRATTTNRQKDQLRLTAISIGRGRCIPDLTASVHPCCSSLLLLSPLSESDGCFPFTTAQATIAGFKKFLIPTPSQGLTLWETCPRQSQL